MRYITVRSISMKQYFQLQELGIKVNLYNPQQEDTKTYGVGCRVPRMLESSNGLRPIIAHVETSVQIPYIYIKDRR